MGRIKDKQAIYEMIGAIDQYLSGCSDLMTIVQTIEFGTHGLDSVGDDWKKRIFEEWVEVEIIYSALLERDETLDGNGRVRSVRPECNDGLKRHFIFHEDGSYGGTR